MPFFTSQNFPVNNAFVWDYFQLWINRDFVLWPIFTAAGHCMWLKKKNYSAHVHHNEGTCHPEQQCGSSMCF